MEAIAALLFIAAVVVFTLGMIIPRRLNLTRKKAALITLCLITGCIIVAPSKTATSEKEIVVIKNEDLNLPDSNKQDKQPSMVYATKPENAQLYKQFDGVWADPSHSPDSKVKFTEKDMDSIGILDTALLQYLKLTYKCLSLKVQYAKIGDGEMQDVDAYFLQVSNGYDGMPYLSRMCEKGEKSGRGVVNILVTPELIENYAISDGHPSDLRYFVKNGSNVNIMGVKPPTRYIETK